MVAFTELCIDLYWLVWKISPTNGCHVFMLIKLVLVLFVKVQLLTILDSGHMLEQTFEVPYTGLYGKFAPPMATMQETFLPNYFKIRQGFLTQRFSKILAQWFRRRCQMLTDRRMTDT